MILSSGFKIGCWHRLWLVISVPWVPLCWGWGTFIMVSDIPASIQIPDISLFLDVAIVPPLIVYVLGWTVGWIVRGFRG